MMLSAVQFDTRAAARIARLPDVVRAARELGIPPMEYVRATIEGGGMAGLGFSFSDTANQVMNLYSQYRQARAPSAAPAPAPTYAAPAQVTRPADATPWYKSMTFLAPAFAISGIGLALFLKKRK